MHPTKCGQKFNILGRLSKTLKIPGVNCRTIIELPNNHCRTIIDPGGSNEILQLYSPITHYTGRVEREERSTGVVLFNNSSRKS